MQGRCFYGGVVFLVILVLFTVQLTLGTRGSAAQVSEVDPTKVSSITFQVNSKDTCWDLANRYLGDGDRCDELIEANDKLHHAGGGDPGLRAGDFLDLPKRWIPKFLVAERADRQHFYKMTVRDIPAMVSQQETSSQDPELQKRRDRHQAHCPGLVVVTDPKLGDCLGTPKEGRMTGYYFITAGLLAVLGLLGLARWRLGWPNFIPGRSG